MNKNTLLIAVGVRVFNYGQRGTSARRWIDILAILNSSLFYNGDQLAKSGSVHFDSNASRFSDQNAPTPISSFPTTSLLYAVSAYGTDFVLV